MVMLPQSNWRKLLSQIKVAGEEGSIESIFDDDYLFLEDVGIFNSAARGELTEFGEAIFDALFIRCDGEEKQLLCQLLLSFPPTIAIQQYLWGVAKVSTEQVLTVLKKTGFWSYVSNEPLTHFLDILNYLAIVSYHK